MTERTTDPSIPLLRQSAARTMVTFAPLTLVTLISSLAIGKALAVTLGPTGTGSYFLAMAALSLGGTLASVGFGPVMSNTFANSPRSAAGRVSLTRFLDTALVISTLCGGGLVGVMLLAQLRAFGFPALGSSMLLTLAAAGVLPSAWFLVLQGALRGTRDFGAYVRVGVVFAAANLALTSAGATIAGAEGAVAGSVAVAAIGVVASARALRKTLRWRAPAISSNRIRQLAAVARVPWAAPASALVRPGLLALIAFTATAVGQMTVRGYLAGAVSLAAVAYFSAAWAITNRVPSLVYQTFSGYLTPTISALRGDWRAIHREQDAALRAGIAVATPLLLVISAGSAFVVPLLLSTSFAPMTPMLRLMIIGEIISIVYWSLTSALFPTGRAFLNAVFEWLWWLLFLAGVLVLSSEYGLRGIGFSYLGAYAIAASVLLGYEMVHDHTRPTTFSAVLLATSIGLLVIAPVAVEQITQAPVAQFSVAVILASIWLAVVFAADPRLRRRGRAAYARASRRRRYSVRG